MGALENYNKWLNSSVVSKEDKEILQNMTTADIDDAFFKDVEFGTAGMRGILGPGTNRLNNYTVRKACVAFAYYLLEVFPNAKEEGVVISHDNRHMSREFTLLCANILADFGLKAYIFDSLRSTPQLSFTVRYKKACGGIMITASHNPKEHNGFKVYDETGCQLVPEKIKRLLEIIASLPDALDLEYNSQNIKGEIITLTSEVDDAYCEAVKTITLSNELDKKGFKIVFTPNHGTSYVNGMRIFNELGYEIYPVLSQISPDPDFSGTLSPNPEDQRSYIEPLKLAKEINAHLIVMTDPDGDRCGLGYLHSDGSYQTLTGNQSAAILMDYIFKIRQEKGLLHDNGVMYNTVVTSTIGEKIADYSNIKTEQFLTGFKFIGNRIHHYELTNDPHFFEFGYEESYGCLIADFVRDKDATQAILMYSEMALYYHRKGLTLDMVLDLLGDKYGHYVNEVTSFAFKGSKGQEEMEAIMNSLRNDPFITLGNSKVVKVEDFLRLTSVDVNGNKSSLDYPPSDVLKLYFDDDSIIAIRPSGTEAKIKTYIEALDKDYKLAREKINLLSFEFKKLLNI